MVNDEKTKNGLMRKTKSELVDIILRKDDVEISLKANLKSKEEDIDVLTSKIANYKDDISRLEHVRAEKSKEIDTLNNRIVGYEADIVGLERMRDENIKTIEELQSALNKKRKTIRRWQIAFAILCVVSVVVIAILA